MAEELQLSLARPTWRNCGEGQQRTAGPAYPLTFVGY